MKFTNVFANKQGKTVDEILSTFNNMLNALDEIEGEQLDISTKENAKAQKALAAAKSAQKEADRAAAAKRNLEKIFGNL